MREMPSNKQLKGYKHKDFTQKDNKSIKNSIREMFKLY